MHRSILLILAVGLIASCKNQSATENAENTSKNESRFATLLKKCKPLQFDTLAIYSSAEPESEDYAFKGVQIDSSEGMYLPAQIKNGLASEMYGTYACGSFPLDNNHTAILLRVPAEYNSNNIELLVLDKVKDSITQDFQLAQLFGDAGDFVEKKSWLYKDANNTPSAFMWMVQTYDHSIDSDEDDTIERTDNYYQFNLLQPVRDTVSKDAKALFNTFKKLDVKPE